MGGGTDCEDGTSMGLHSKHFIIDDVEATTRFLEEYWTPMWRCSHQEGVDFELQEVMEGLDVDRDGDPSVDASAKLDEKTRKLIQELEQSQNGANRHGKFYETTISD